MPYYSIAIDGPAASGKSTAAKAVSKALGFLYVDTGAMYRAFTLYMIENNLDTKSEEDAKKLLPSLVLKEDRDGRIFLNGRDVTKRVREEDVTALVSYACAHKCVRERLVEIQQEMAKTESVVMDGRDIGTVVLPNATLKVYQVASVASRAERRYKEEIARNRIVSLEEIQKDIERRDYIDSHRENSPLKPAEDAIFLDTSNLTIQEEIDAIIALFRKKVSENE